MALATVLSSAVCSEPKPNVADIGRGEQCAENGPMSAEEHMIIKLKRKRKKAARQRARQSTQ